MPEGNPAETQQSTAKARAASATAMPGMEAALATGAAGLEALFQSTGNVFKLAASVSEELMSFTDKRLRAMVDTTQSVVKSSTWSEAYELQSKHARLAVEDYFAEANRIFDISARATSEGLAPLQNFAKSTQRH